MDLHVAPEELSRAISLADECARTLALIDIEPPNDKGLCKVTWEFPEVNVRFHTYSTRYTSVNKVTGKEEIDE